MKIGVDFDGVIADPMQTLLTVVHTKWGKRVSLKDLTSWDYRHILGIDLRQEGLWDEVFLNQHIPVVPGAMESLVFLQEMGHEVVIVTSRDPKEFGFIAAYLYNHLPDAKYTVNAYTTVEAQGGGLDLDFMLDDDPLKLLRLRNVVRYQRILFQRPWNVSCLDVAGYLTRVDGWPGFMVRLAVAMQMRKLSKPVAEVPVSRKLV
jgi:5'(3')-deoxyribonucleotidase